jgi:3',5'-cyclic AMP phosphodiesterase CpdA
VTRPFLIAHLSDPHLGATWADCDPAAGLAAAIDTVRRLPDRPDAVLVTGDLADNRTAGECEQARALLARLDPPLYVAAGNRDDRDVLRGHFAIAGRAGAPVQYAVDLGPLRLVVLDTTRPGEDRGELDAARLRWLDGELARAPEQITLLAMHHPPILTGSTAWDRIGLGDGDRRALGEVLQRHPQVRRIVAGHVHRTIASEVCGRTVLTAPSTYAHACPGFSTAKLEFAAGPPGFAVHALMNGSFVSHIHSANPGVGRR